MNKFVSISIFTLSMPFAASAALTFDGASLPVVEVRPAASTGLEMIYVINNASGVRVSYTGGGTAWQSFGSSGGAYAEDLPASGGTVTLSGGDTGIIVTSGGRQYCYWIVDYSRHELELRNLSAAPGESDCSRMALALDGRAEAIPFYTITGRRDELGRELKLSYTTLAFDEDAFAYTTAEEEKILAGAGALFGIEAPLCDTRFRLSGDRFLRAWKMERSVESEMCATQAIAAETKAVQTERSNDNEQSDNADSGLGGSAPCEIEFSAAVSDGVVFREWQISRSPDFEIPENTFNEESFTYTFLENGTSYVRFVADNDAGTCGFTGTTYEIFIGESRLDIPNAFSPGASPGVNDEWKVSYKSLVEFECHIFNKWGIKMCSLTDPSQGWDGKYNGKVVPAGTYYYVIKAKGADGKEYKKSGDINIINYSGGSATGSGGEKDPE